MTVYQQWSGSRSAPVVKERVLQLFRTSLAEGVLPTQWRNARIIPLKKPKRGNYSLGKAWRPISLLATLGKVLESVVAERISYTAETLAATTNHFGARKQRSAEQALLVPPGTYIQGLESRKVLSLISFDVKEHITGSIRSGSCRGAGPRNPSTIVRWISAFLLRAHSQHSGKWYTSPQQQLPQADYLKGLRCLQFCFYSLMQTWFSSRSTIEEVHSLHGRLYGLGHRPLREANYAAFSR